jgi:hypothetical protein
MFTGAPTSPDGKTALMSFDRFVHQAGMIFRKARHDHPQSSFFDVSVFAESELLRIMGSELKLYVTGITQSRLMVMMIDEERELELAELRPPPAPTREPAETVSVAVATLGPEWRRNPKFTPKWLEYYLTVIKKYWVMRCVSAVAKFLKFAARADEFPFDVVERFLRESAEVDCESVPAMQRVPMLREALAVSFRNLSYDKSLRDLMGAYQQQLAVAFDEAMYSFRSGSASHEEVQSTYLADVQRILERMQNTVSHASVSPGQLDLLRLRSSEPPKPPGRFQKPAQGALAAAASSDSSSFEELAADALALMRPAASGPSKPRFPDHSGGQRGAGYKLDYEPGMDRSATAPCALTRHKGSGHSNEECRSQQKAARIKSELASANAVAGRPGILKNSSVRETVKALADMMRPASAMVVTFAPDCAGPSEDPLAAAARKTNVCTCLLCPRRYAHVRQSSSRHLGQLLLLVRPPHCRRRHDSTLTAC